MIYSFAIMLFINNKIGIFLELIEYVQTKTWSCISIIHGNRLNGRLKQRRNTVYSDIVTWSFRWIQNEEKRLPQFRLYTLTLSHGHVAFRWIQNKEKLSSTIRINPLGGREKRHFSSTIHLTHWLADIKRDKNKVKLCFGPIGPKN